MPLPLLRAGFLTVAYKIQEAAILLSNSDVERRLDAALRAAKEDYWCYIVAVFGDDKKGDVVYSCDGGLRKAGYTCSPTGATIDTAAAIEVLPMTTYVPVSDALTEAGARHSKGDMKMLQTVHDHAVSLGAACSTKEAKGAPGNQGVRLNESMSFVVDIPLKEAFGADKKIKLIAPGKGSSAWYEADVLKRDGPKIFVAGTPMRIDHPTSAQEAERPEGSVRDWGAVLAKDAFWLESHPQGPGLYSEIKPFSDHALTIEEKGPYAGVSIAAWGEAKRENGAVVMREGVPVLAALTSADGVDMVTRAGAGGMFLTEAARSVADHKEGAATDMDAAELKNLQEGLAESKETNRKLLERAIRGDAREHIASVLKGNTLHDAGKELVMESVMRGALPMKDGELDTAALKESVDAETKKIGAAIAAAIGSGTVRGMGAAPVVPIDAKEVERKENDAKRAHESAVATFTRFGMDKTAAEAAARGRAS